MAGPDIRVDTDDLDAAGAELVRVGAAVAASAEGSRALTPGPDRSDGFASVGATAMLGARVAESLQHTGDRVTACGTAMRDAAAAWRAADDAVAASLRAG